MSPAAILEEVCGLAGLATSAAQSDPRWWTSYQIAGICLRAAQRVDWLARVEGADPFVWTPVRSRRTVKPITADTVRSVLSMACSLFHYWLDTAPAEDSALVARDRAWAMLYALDGHAYEAFETPAHPEPIRPEFVPNGAAESWIARWSTVD